MNKEKIKAVIFDCDGTLVDSEHLGGQAMYEIALRYGCLVDEPTLIQACLGSNMEKSIALINARSPVPMPACFAQEVRDLMNQKFHSGLTEIAGAKALLTELKRRCIPVAIATNGPRAKAELTLGLTGLLPFFQNPDRLFSAYEHHTFKPEPQLFLLAAAALNIQPKNCAAIEDSWSGLAAGLSAKMQTFSVVQLSKLTQPLSAKPIELISLSDFLVHL